MTFVIEQKIMKMFKIIKKKYQMIIKTKKTYKK